MTPKTYYAIVNKKGRMATDWYSNNPALFGSRREARCYARLNGLTVIKVRITEAKQ